MKHWGPHEPTIQKAIDLARRLECKSILDIGGNPNYTFPLATSSIGWQGEVKLDIAREKLPYADKEIDFVFCRHTLEDLADPSLLLSEIKRIAKAGYIETPSTKAELTRGVDAMGSHLGYAHHRWIFASQEGKLIAVPKYPIAERLPLRDHWQELQQDAELWNMCHLWEGDLNYELLENEAGLRLCLYDERGFQAEYLAILEILTE